MSVPMDKQQLLAAMTKNWEALQKKLARIPPEQAFTPLLEGHAKSTQMSVADLVSYLIGWGEQVLYWHQQERAGATPDSWQPVISGMSWASWRKNITPITPTSPHGRHFLSGIRRHIKS